MAVREPAWNTHSLVTLYDFIQPTAAGFEDGTVTNCVNLFNPGECTA